MCEIVQRFVNEGREKEREELIKKMLDANLVTPEQIASLLKISVAEVKKIAKKVSVEA